MKRILTLFALLLLASLILPQQAGAQSPEKMSYQAVIRNSSNNLITNTTVGMKISILQGSTTGTVEYAETQTPTTNANGLVSIEIGAGTVISGIFSAIDWANGPYFLKTETDPSGGTNYTITGTSQLLSVPYALHAKTAESITEPFIEIDPVYLGSQAVNITASDIVNLSNLSGINSGDQDISGIAVNATDIATIQAEQTVQDAAIAVNTAKVGLTPAQETILANTSGVNTGDQDGSETKINAGTNVTVTGTGTAASPYVINASGIISYTATGGGGIQIASTSIPANTRTQILQLTGVPAGTYAVFFSCPVSNTSTSTNGLNITWALTTNSGSAGFPGSGIASGFIPATGWTLSYVFGQSGFRVITLGSTGTIELLMCYWGTVLTGDVRTTGTPALTAIRL
jgi:hypothetical protein